MNRFLASSFPALAIATLAILAGCMTPPPDLDLSLQHPSQGKMFVVVMEPPAATPAINQIHAWQVKISAPNGMPVTHARIDVDGGMPQHGHGLPTRPQVTRELADGTYLLEGMKFSMTGWWEIKLAIDAPQGTDKVIFNRVVTDPGAGR
jgi:hypothetical protein